MASPPTPRTVFTPTRWLLPAVLVVLGLGLFFALGSRTEPVARPATLEVAP